MGTKVRKKRSGPAPETRTENQMPQLPAASISRLLAAWVYDGLLLFAVLFVATALYILPQQLLKPIDSDIVTSLSASQYSGPLYYGFIILVIYFFFAWFWTHGGQTLGLRAWSLKIQTNHGSSISWRQSLLRLMAAAAPWIAAVFAYEHLSQLQLIPAPEIYVIFLIGLVGLLWAFIDKRHRTLQDIISNTRIVKVPKKKS